MIYYRYALIIVSVSFFFSGSPFYLNKQDGNLAPIYWLSIFYVLAAPFVMRAIQTINFWKSPLVLWCVGFFWISLLGMFVSSQTDVVWRGMRLRLLTIATLLTYLALLWDTKSLRVARWSIVPAVLLGVALNVYELLVPMTFSHLPGRSVGLYGNPNIAGEALVLGMVCSVGVLPAWARLPYMLLTAMGVFTTVSRACILGWILASIGLLLMMRTARLKHLVVTGGVIALLTVGVLVPQWDSFMRQLEISGTVSKDVLERLEWFADPTGVSDGSSAGRAQVARYTWERIVEYPIFGRGTAASYEELDPPHNQYLAFMEDHGVVVGLFILPSIILAVMWKARGESKLLAMLFGGTVLWLSCFSNNMVEYPHSLLLFATIAILSELSVAEEDHRPHLAPVAGLKKHFSPSLAKA